VYWHSSATLTEVFPCFFLTSKANARVKLAKIGHGQHSSKISCLCCSVVICVVLYIVCAVAKWLRYNRKVAGSIPDGVTGIFH
jgi:hypothetical protein